MRVVLRAVVQNLCQKLPGMTDPLSTQLPPAGNVPPSKKLKLDSVSDGGKPCWGFACRAKGEGCKPFAGRRAIPYWGLPNRPRLLSCSTRAAAVLRSVAGRVLSLLARCVGSRGGRVSCVFRVCAAKACYTGLKAV